MLQNPDYIKEEIIGILKEYKANDILLVNLGELAVADHIIIASGTSGRHIVTLKEKISSQMKHKYGLSCLAEGEEAANWIVLDLEHIVVHLFRPEVRDYYEIDSLWTEDKKSTIPTA